MTQLDTTNIPQHIAIIMDGNGRWAAEQGKPRSYGHQAGVDAVRRITSECTRLGVKYLTLYTFSTENWNRPATEVAALMGLVLTSLEDEIFMKNNVRFQVVGEMGRLPQMVQDIMLLAPTTHFVSMAQAILYRGAGLSVVWPQFLALLAIGSVLFALSLARFRKTITQMA